MPTHLARRFDVPSMSPAGDGGGELGEQFGRRPGGVDFDAGRAFATPLGRRRPTTPSIFVSSGVACLSAWVIDIFALALYNPAAALAVGRPILEYVFLLIAGIFYVIIKSL